ncbi:hypothetical protein Bealeia1_01757 [Candidatus Bealeia paramacronuclearis]|uniref:Uncharacterized protein n=1 Tax=Candidatus Bealeia paramacronuclearis TaxID=1921001 RepID=A0ABZ2CAR9_9PROT|nr:hypothetical protein [Candidatus Bealeia paramacronuclearis]
MKKLGMSIYFTANVLVLGSLYATSKTEVVDINAKIPFDCIEGNAPVQLYCLEMTDWQDGEGNCNLGPTSLTGVTQPDPGNGTTKPCNNPGVNSLVETCKSFLKNQNIKAIA